MGQNLDEKTMKRHAQNARVLGRWRKAWEGYKGALNAHSKILKKNGEDYSKAFFEARRNGSPVPPIKKAPPHPRESASDTVVELYDRIMGINAAGFSGETREVIDALQTAAQQDYDLLDVSDNPNITFQDKSRASVAGMGAMFRPWTRTSLVEVLRDAELRFKEFSTPPPPTLRERLERGREILGGTVLKAKELANWAIEKIGGFAKDLLLEKATPILEEDIPSLPPEAHNSEGSDRPISDFQNMRPTDFENELGVYSPQYESGVSLDEPLLQTIISDPFSEAAYGSGTSLLDRTIGYEPEGSRIKTPSYDL